MDDIRQLQSQKSGLLAKQDIYGQLAEAKAQLMDATCRVEFLERQNQKKDERIRQLELELYRKKEEEQQRLT